MKKNKIKKHIWFFLVLLLIFIFLLIKRIGIEKSVEEKLEVEELDKYAVERKNMVSTQLKTRDITDNKVLSVMGKVERHKFVPEDSIGQAYEDNPLPIGYGQTISQPYIVALMTQSLELKENDRVLEIGTGSAYQAAVLAEIVKDV